MPGNFQCNHHRRRESPGFHSTDGLAGHADSIGQLLLRNLVCLPEFMNMISDSEILGIKVLVFSDQSRLSRDIIVQESTYRLLSSRGYSLISSENPNSFLEDTPTSNLIRQIMGSFCEFDRSSTVSKLKVSRIRKRESNRDKGIVTRNREGKCEGRKRILEIHPELESLILKLRKKGLSWVNISKTLSDELGYSISSMSVGRILKDIDWMKKEKRRMNRKKKSSPILNVV